jgi:molybdate transport system substrate-binding protein
MAPAIRVRYSLSHIVGLTLALVASCKRGAAHDHRAEQAELLVFAAASTAEPLADLGREFEHERGTKVRFSLGASRDLGRQIRAGAPADVIVSADVETVEGLLRDGLAPKGSAKRIMSNLLAVVVPTSSHLEIRGAGDLARASHIALGDPAIVPAGRYAKAWLEKAGVWGALEPHVVPTLDVRAALAAAENGQADAAIVYRSDAAISSKVRVAYDVPREAAPAIEYVAAPLATPNAAAASVFVDFLIAPLARSTFARYGFGP